MGLKDGDRQDLMMLRSILGISIRPEVNICGSQLEICRTLRQRLKRHICFFLQAVELQTAQKTYPCTHVLF